MPIEQRGNNLAYPLFRDRHAVVGTEPPQQLEKCVDRGW
jgi:hypothetical protein